VTDYGEIVSLQGDHAVVATNREAVALAMNDTTIDMSMIAWGTDWFDDLKALVQSGAVSMDRIDESVKRILEVRRAR
jgi:beta-glucosidase